MFVRLIFIVIFLAACGDRAPVVEDPPPTTSKKEDKEDKEDKGDLNATENGPCVKPVPVAEENSAEGFQLTEQKHYYLKAEWQTPLEAGGDGTNRVTLHFLNAAKKTPGSIELKGFHPSMPAMGHGTDEETQVFKNTSPSTVEVSGIYFNMGGKPGEWVVQVIATVDGKTDEVKIELPEVLE